VVICLLTYIINGSKVYPVIGFIALLTNYFSLGAAHDTLLFKHDIQYSGVILIIGLYLFDIYRTKSFSFVSNRMRNRILVFFSFIILTGVFDVLYNGTSVADVFLVTKSWIYILSFFVLSKLSFEELNKIVQIICVITIIHTFIYYFQYATGIIIVETKLIEQSINGSQTTRYGYPPYFSYLVILLLISNVYKVKVVFKYVILTLIIGTTILSLTRSMTVAFLLSILVYKSFQNLNIIKYSVVVVIAIVVLPLLLKDTKIYTRISDGAADVTNTYTNFSNLELTGTFSYRILHLTERVNYLRKNIKTTLVGIGYIHEKNYEETPFEYGIYQEEYGRNSQFGTADISWSGLFLRHGFLGVILYLLFSAHFFKTFFKFRKYPMAKVGFTFLLISFLILSFTSSRVAFGNFWPIVFIIYFHLQKSRLLIHS
jgi:hypothetical protein